MYKAYEKQNDTKIRTIEDSQFTHRLGHRLVRCSVDLVATGTVAAPCFTDRLIDGRRTTLEGCDVRADTRTQSLPRMTHQNEKQKPAVQESSNHEWEIEKQTSSGLHGEGLDRAYLIGRIRLKISRKLSNISAKKLSNCLLALPIVSQNFTRTICAKLNKILWY